MAGSLSDHVHARKTTGLPLEEADRVQRLEELRKELLQAAGDRAPYAELVRLEKEIEELEKSADQHALDRERIHSPSQQRRYEWIKSKTGEQLKPTAELVDLMEYFKLEVSKLPPGSPKIAYLKKGVLHLAKEDGSGAKELQLLEKILEAGIKSARAKK